MHNTTKPTLLLDIDKYQHHLDHCNLTPEEQEEFLHTVWNMVCDFVLLGFNIHPLQELSGDKTAETSALPTLMGDTMLSSLIANTEEKGAEE